MSGLPAHINNDSQVDLIGDSIAHPLALAFSKSSSPNYGPAVELAKLATKYAEKSIGKSILHMAVFGADRLQMSRALALLRYIKGLKSTQLYAGGKLLFSTHRTEEVISCFLTAASCTDWRAHCHRLIRSPFAGNSERMLWIASDTSMSDSKCGTFDKYLFPCKFMTRYGEIHFRLDARHEASPVDQIQAMAVGQDCAWCPNFNQNDFKKL